MPSNMAEKILIRGVVIAILIFLIGPLFIVCGLSLSKANLIKFPPQELSLRWFADVWKLDGFIAAVVLSLKLAALTTIGTSVLGVMGSLALVGYRFAGARGFPVRRQEHSSRGFSVASGSARHRHRNCAAAVFQDDRPALDI